MNTILPTPAGYDPEEVEQAQILTRDRVLKKTLEWQNLRAAGLIDQEDLHLIQLYDHKPVPEKVSLFRDNPNGHVNLFITLVGGGKNVSISLDRARYGLSLIEELLEAEPDAAKYFLQLPDPYNSFLRLMNTRTDNYCAAKAVKLLALLIIKSPGAASEAHIGDILRWCNDKLRNASEVAIALEGLQTLLRNDHIRTIFAQQDGLGKLCSVLKIPNLSSQLIYETLYCLWLMSYNKEISDSFSKTNVIARIVEILKTIQKEKVIRVGLAILVNIANMGENNQQMIEAKIGRVLDLFNQKRWADDDLVNDLEFLTKLVAQTTSEMSSWDSYKTELLSKELEWSPVHTSEKFWRENVIKFEENGFEALSMLVGLLHSPNPQVLQVVCHDIGEFIRFHPRGRDIFSNQMKSSKYLIMKMMEHNDPGVQKEALLCTQKLLVNSWEHLSQR